MSSDKRLLKKKPTKYAFYAFCVFFIITLACLGLLNGFAECLRFTAWCMIAEIIIRIAQIIEYDMSLGPEEWISRNTLGKIWNFNNYSFYSIFGIAFLVTSLSLENALFNLRYLLPAICGSLFVRAINFSESSYMKSLWVENSSGLDYGSGMAYSYFFGYLNIVLPHRGDENSGIKEIMKKYENTEDVKFGAKKLFVLIPRSLYCPPDLKEISKGPVFYMESAKSMDCVARDRAGVKSRVYKNCVYKIYTKDQKEKPVYVVAECATLLLSLYETIKCDGIHQERYRENRDEIILRFYRTLQYLINNDPACKDVCELIYFDNLEKDVNAAELIMQRITEIQNKKSK